MRVRDSAFRDILTISSHACSSMIRSSNAHTHIYIYIYMYTYAPGEAELRFQEEGAN